jgi:hypothetical protein
MNLLPIARRELRLLARRPATYWSRVLAAAVALAAGLSMIFAGFAGMMNAASAGHGLLVVVAVAGALLALLEGTLATADALSSERREGTLGFLFLTDLRGHDIVFGKLVARASRPFNALLAMLPMPALGVLVGGVSPREAAPVMLALVNTLFVAAAFGLFVSATGRSARRVKFAALSGVLLLCVGTLLLVMLGREWFGNPSPLDVLSLLSPLTAVTVVLSPTTAPAGTLVVALAVPHALGWVLLVAASVRLQRSWRDEPQKVRDTGSEVPRWKRRWREFLRAPRRPVGDTPPLIWLGERRESPRGLLAQLALTLLAVLLLVAAFEPEAMTEPFALFLAGLAMHVVFSLKADAMAGRALLAEKHSGLLEMLLITPLGVDDILEGTMLALKRQLLGPVAFLLGADAILILLGCLQLEGWGAVVWVIGYAGMIALSLGTTYLSVWINFHDGLSTGSRSSATKRQLLLILGVPFLVTLVTAALLGIVTGGRFFQGLAVPVLALWYVALMLAAFVALYGRAVHRLRSDLPALAARTPAPTTRKSRLPWRQRLRAGFTRR